MKTEFSTPIIGSVISSVVAWALKEFSEATVNHVISFIVTFSPIFIGLLVYFVIWITIDYRKLKKTYLQTVENGFVTINGNINTIHRTTQEQLAEIKQLVSKK